VPDHLPLFGEAFPESEELPGQFASVRLRERDVFELLERRFRPIGLRRGLDYEVRGARVGKSPFCFFAAHNLDTFIQSVAGVLPPSFIAIVSELGGNPPLRPPCCGQCRLALRMGSQT
jgi:hypothetical protein